MNNDVLLVNQHTTVQPLNHIYYCSNKHVTIFRRHNVSGQPVCQTIMDFHTGESKLTVRYREKHFTGMPYVWRGVSPAYTTGHVTVPSLADQSKCLIKNYFIQHYIHEKPIFLALFNTG